MPERPDFIRHQYAFAAHIRDPARNPRPADVEERRMAIYRDLFYKNLASLLAANFPVLRRVMPDPDWHAMVRDFFIKHRCGTPLFPELGQEFLAYLQNERAAAAADPPFLLELAHYEWVELALSISDEDAGSLQADPAGDLMAGHPLISPLAWNLTYRFPVHCIGPDYQPDSPEGPPTHIVVYRNARDEVEFLEINAVTQRLLELLREHPRWTGRKAVERIAAELRHPDPEQVLRAGAALLEDLRRRDIILGTRRAVS